MILDVATLTGHRCVALGDRIAGVMGNDDDSSARVRRRPADAAGEAHVADADPRASCVERLDASQIADLCSTTGVRWGGGHAHAAASSSREFVGDGIPWAHLDIAGPAFNASGAYGPLTPRAAPASASRTLVGLAESYVADPRPRPTDANHVP